VSYFGVPLDTVSNSVKIIDYAHHENHDGNYYRCGGIFATLAAATDYYVSIVVPATHSVHLNFEIDANTENGYTLYEGTTATPGAGITTPAIICKNRLVKNTSAITVKAGLVGAWGVMTPGTMLTYKRVGSGKASGGDAGSGEEWILSNGTWIIKFSNYANPGALTGWWKCGWYELTL